MLASLIQMVAQFVGLIVVGLAVPVFLIGVTAIYEGLIAPKRRVRAQRKG